MSDGRSSLAVKEVADKPSSNIISSNKPKDKSVASPPPNTTSLKSKQTFLILILLKSDNFEKWNRDEIFDYSL